MNVKSLALAVGVAATLSAGSALSAPIPLPSPIAILEDDNIEYAIRTIDGVDTILDPAVYGAETLKVGDRLRAVITFSAVKDSGNNTTFNLKGDGPPPPNRELTGISEIEVKAIVAGSFVFGPTASFEAVYGAGAMAALFTQSPGNFLTSCNADPVDNIAACEDPATDGDPWLTVGFADPDDFWVAASALPVGFDTISLGTVAGLAATTKVGVANYALSILSNNTGYNFQQQLNPLSALFGIGPAVLQDGLVDIIGSGDILGGAGLTGPWFARSDFDFQLYRIPEPATLALLGLGLAGMGFSARRRKSLM